MSAVAQDHARRTYDAFAGFYDDFTSHHDDELWTGALEAKAKLHGLRGTRLLDVGCGTGRSFIPMLARGYSVVGCDISEGMVERARTKAPGARVVVRDMRRLDALGEFDLIWALGDAFNYLQDAGEVDATLAGIRANLARGGLFVCDVNTLGTFRTVYSSLLVKPAAEQVLVLDGMGRPDLEPGQQARVLIDRLAPADDGWWLRTRTVHHHRHHPPGQIDDAIRSAGMEPLETYGSLLSGDLEQPLDEHRHVKAVVIARG